MNRLDAETVQSAFRSIFAEQHGLNGPVHCRDHSQTFLRDRCLQSVQKGCVILPSDGFSLLKIDNEKDCAALFK